MEDVPRVIAKKADLDELRAAGEWAAEAVRRSAEAAQRAVDTLSARRARLVGHWEGITRATEIYAQLDHGDVQYVRIRTAFIRRDEPRKARDTDWDRGLDIGSRPPMSRLIAGSGSRALPTYLTMLYRAHLRENAAGRVFVNDIPNLRTCARPRPWVDLAGMYRPPDAGMTPSANRRRLRKSLTTALDTLREHQLIALIGAEGAAGRYDEFTVLADDDTEDQYSVPGEGVPNKTAIRIPSTFFYNGWHLVLTPAEIAVLLAIIDRTGYLSRKPRSGAVREMGVDLKESQRWGIYGLSGEAYNAIHMLRAFGLIHVLDPMPNRARPIPYFSIVAIGDGAIRFDLEDDQRIPFRLLYPPATTHATVDTLFDLNAYDTALAALDAAIAVEHERIDLISEAPD